MAFVVVKDNSLALACGKTLLIFSPAGLGFDDRWFVAWSDWAIFRAAHSAHPHCRHGVPVSCLRSRCVKDGSTSAHDDSIRAVCFDRSGSLVATVADDKVVKLWSCESGACISSRSSPYTANRTPRPDLPRRAHLRGLKSQRSIPMNLPNVQPAARMQAWAVWGGLGGSQEAAEEADCRCLRLL